MALDGVQLVNEAAHIKWHAYEGPDVIPNGLLLCPLHHATFDRGMFTVNSAYEVQVSDHVTGGQGTKRWLFDYHGKRILLPRDKRQYPDPVYLHWPLREVFRKAAS